jgi:hypothetical protein
MQQNIPGASQQSNKFEDQLEGATSGSTKPILVRSSLEGMVIFKEELSARVREYSIKARKFREKSSKNRVYLNI